MSNDPLKMSPILTNFKIQLAAVFHLDTKDSKKLSFYHPVCQELPQQLDRQFDFAVQAKEPQYERQSGPWIVGAVIVFSGFASEGALIPFQFL